MTCQLQAIQRPLQLVRHVAHEPGGGPVVTIRNGKRDSSVKASPVWLSNCDLVMLATNTVRDYSCPCSSSNSSSAWSKVCSCRWSLRCRAEWMERASSSQGSTSSRKPHGSCRSAPSSSRPRGQSRSTLCRDRATGILACVGNDCASEPAAALADSGKRRFPFNRHARRAARCKEAVPSTFSPSNGTRPKSRRSVRRLCGKSRAVKKLKRTFWSLRIWF